MICHSVKFEEAGKLARRRLKQFVLTQPICDEVIHPAMYIYVYVRIICMYICNAHATTPISLEGHACMGRVLLLLNECDIIDTNSVARERW